MGNTTIIFSHEGSVEDSVAGEYTLLDINLENTLPELSTQLLEDIREALETYWGYPASVDAMTAHEVAEVLKPQIIIPKTHLPPM